MQQTPHILKGKPVLIMRRGTFPNRAEIRDIQASYPGSVVRTEPWGIRFVVTVAKR